MSLIPATIVMLHRQHKMQPIDYMCDDMNWFSEYDGGYLVREKVYPLPTHILFEISQFLPVSNGEMIVRHNGVVYLKAPHAERDNPYLELAPSLFLEQYYDENCECVVGHLREVPAIPEGVLWRIDDHLNVCVMGPEDVLRIDMSK